MDDPCIYTRPLLSGRKRWRSPSTRTWIAGNSTAVPSGRTARSGAYTLTLAPVYTIKVPSGDHTGFSAIPATRRTGAPPPTGILNRPGPFASLPPVTIHLTSGDQDAGP